MYTTLSLGAVLDQAGIFIAAVVLTVVAWHVWLSYIQTAFLESIKWALLEVRPPKEVQKSPLAMELVLNALQGGKPEGNFFAKYWKGELILWYSLEIVSIEGKVRFFIRTPDKFKKLIQTQIYAQYPQAEVVEAEDYTQQVPDYKKNGPISLWGTMQVLNKDEVIPIKTYVNYGLDRAIGTLEEEQRIDPITPLLEFMGSLGAGQQAWMQVLVRPVPDRFTVKNKEGIEEPGKKWTDKVKEVVKGMTDALKEKDADGKTVARKMTPSEQEALDSIERNGNKYAYDTAIRMIYLANKDNFDVNAPNAFGASLRQFNANNLNGFKGDKATRVELPWQDIFGTKVDKMKAKMLGGYKKRAFFYGGFDFKLSKFFPSLFTHPNESGGKPFIMTTEELATIFHLPGRVVETPTFSRIEATKAEPPSNLPI